MFNRIVRFFVAAVFMAVSFCAFSKDFFVVTLPVEGPWNYFQEDGEQLTGIDIDILRAISRESGYKFEFKPMSPSRAMAELKNDNIDAIAGVSSNFATVNGLLFTKPYMSDISQMVYQKPDAQKPVTKYKDLYTHVVGVIRTFSYFDELDDYRLYFYGMDVPKQFFVGDFDRFPLVQSQIRYRRKHMQKDKSRNEIVF